MPLLSCRWCRRHYVFGLSVSMFVRTCVDSGVCLLQRSNDRRYLLCPAYISVSVLKKFIHVKFELSTKHHVRSFCFCLMLLATLHTIGWLGSRVVSVLDSVAEGPGSNRSRDAVR